MFGFLCKNKIDKAKEEAREEFELEIKELNEKISALEDELSKREKCSNNTLEKLDIVDKEINQLKQDILNNSSDNSKSKIPDENVVMPS